MRVESDVIIVELTNPMSPNATKRLRHWFDQIEARHANGLGLLGGYRIKFETQPSMNEI